MAIQMNSCEVEVAVLGVHTTHKKSPRSLSCLSAMSVRSIVITSGCGSNMGPKFNPGKWKCELKSAVSWLLNFDPQPSQCNSPIAGTATRQAPTCMRATGTHLSPLAARPAVGVEASLLFQSLVGTSWKTTRPDGSCSVH